MVAPWFFGEAFLSLIYVEAGEKLFTSANLSNAPMHALLRHRGWSSCGMLHWSDDDDPEIFFAKVLS